VKLGGKIERPGPASRRDLFSTRLHGLPDGQLCAGEPALEVATIGVKVWSAQSNYSYRDRQWE